MLANRAFQQARPGGAASLPDLGSKLEPNELFVTVILQRELNHRDKDLVRVRALSGQVSAAPNKEVRAMGSVSPRPPPQGLARTRIPETAVLH